MGKLRFVFALVFLVSSMALAQQPPTQGAYFDPASINQIFKVTRFIGGVPVFSPSLLTDNGTTLLYNGLPVGGGGTAGVASLSATPTGLFTLNLPSPVTGAVVITPTLISQPANCAYGNFTGSAAAPNCSSTPAFNGANITGLAFTQLSGAASIAQVPATLVQSVGTTAGNAMLKWVTSNTATNSSIVDNGTNVTTTEPVIAPSFAGSALALTSFPTGQFATSALVSPIISGLIGEFHYQDAANATTSPNFVAGGASGTYFGTPTLTGTTKGGMISAGNGGMDLPVAFNSTALTLSTYTCADSTTSIANLYDIMIGGLISSTLPSTGNTQVYGVMLQGTQGTALGNSIGKYGLSPSVFNNATVSTQSTETVNNCHLITVIRGTTHDQLFIDDHEAKGYQYQNAGTATTVPSSGSLSVGMAHYATLPQANYAHPYPIYYHFDFNRALSLDEIKALSGSTATAAAFRGITPAVQPYSDAGNQLLAVGDSITYGLNSGTNGWPSLLTGLTNNVYSVTNISTPGWQLENVITECQTRGQGAMNPNMNNTVTLYAGTNDLAQIGAALGTVTPAVAYQRLRRAVQCYKGLSPMPRVFVIDMIARGIPSPLGPSAANDLLKNQYNDLVHRDWAGADGGIAIASFAGLGADGASITTGTACAGGPCFGGDVIHPTAAGQQIIANLVAAYLNWADSKTNGINPKQVTTATATIASGDVAIAAVPSAAQTLTLPSSVGLVGTDRYINNTQSTNTVTIAAASGENIDGASTLVCPSNTKCALRAVLGTTPGLSNPDVLAGAHWEQFGFSGGGGSSGNATSIQGVAVSATAPTLTNNVQIYNGTVYAPGVVSGTTVPQMTSTVQGIGNCDGTTITCTGGVLTAVGGGSGAVSSVFTRTGAVVAASGDYTVAQVTGAAPLASPTFTGTTVISGTALNITATTIQKGGTGAHLSNQCGITLLAGATTGTCTVTGGASGNQCSWAASNLAAQQLINNVTTAVAITSSGNIPRISMSGTTATLTFLTGGSGTFINTPLGAAGPNGAETFNVDCPI